VRGAEYQGGGASGGSVPQEHSRPDRAFVRSRPTPPWCSPIAGGSGSDAGHPGPRREADPNPGRFFRTAQTYGLNP
jgi:hypothetical protein